MTAEKTLYTIDDLYNLPDDGRRYELLDGELVEMAPASLHHGGLMNNVGHLVTLHVRPRRLGRVVVGDPGIILGGDPDRVRGPDVAFYARGRLPAGDLPNTFSPVVPDLVVEIISPSDRTSAVRRKTEEWLRSGVLLVLTIDPENRTVEVARGLDRLLIYHDGESFTCEPVLPELSLSVTEMLDTDDE